MSAALFGILVVIAGLLVHVPGRGEPTPSAPSVRITTENVVVTSASRDDVRVQYKLVRVPAPAADPIRKPVRLTRVTRGATPQPSVLAKARRLIVGNGRHRPQPFPTVRP